MVCLKRVATLLPFRFAFWNLKTRRNAVDACVNGKWQLSLTKGNDYFRVIFYHFLSKHHFLRQLGQY